MKKTLLSVMLAAFVAVTASAFDLSGLLGGSNNSGNNNNSKVDTALGALGGLINSVTASNDFQLSDLAGTWKYDSPAVTFASENALQKLGGAAASAAVESKLAPYYKRFGVTGITMTVDADANFTMALKGFSLTGTIERSDDGHISFNFKAFNTITIGSISANVTKSGNMLNVTFDVSKISNVLQTVAQVSGNSSVKALSGILSSYDGVYAGFKLRKQG